MTDRVLVVLLLVVVVCGPLLLWGLQPIGTLSDCTVTSTFVPFGAPSPHGNVSCSNGQTFQNVPSTLGSACDIRVGDNVTLTMTNMIPVEITGDSNC
jgi:hypothetical protein